MRWSDAGPGAWAVARRLLLSTALSLVMLCAGQVLPAGATTASDASSAVTSTTADQSDPQFAPAVAALKDQRVWVAPGAEQVLDEAAVADAVAADRADIVVAVLAPLEPAPPAATASAAATVADRIRVELASENLFVVVVTAQDIAVAGARPEASLLADMIEQQAELSTADGRTDAVVELIEQLQSLERGDQVAVLEPARSSASAGGALAVLGVVVTLLGLAVVGGVLLSRRHRTDAAMLAAEAQALHDRLGADVAALDPGDDEQARTALVTASEALARCGQLLSSAVSSQDYRAARAVAVHGLAATDAVRRLTGIEH